MARDSFSTFIPLSVDSDARTKIIFDFFELLAAIAANAKTNGLGGRKLSRYAGWWAFEHADSGKGFDWGYKGWTVAADATSHLFFAYLRSMSPETSHGLTGISTLPRSLQKLVAETEYPPETPSLMLYTTPKIVMIVDFVSPSPFALLNRAKNFQYRDQDAALQEFSNYEDPVKALTPECGRVIELISNSTQSQEWSFDETEEDALKSDLAATQTQRRRGHNNTLSPTARSGNVLGGRPTTPAWGETEKVEKPWQDFMSEGFSTKDTSLLPLTMPTEKINLPVDTFRGRSSQSHRPRLEHDRNLEPGELASITSFDLDESFWWVWISSLAGEEPAQRKAAFGRCALVETEIPTGKWIVIEEQVKGAADEPGPEAYVAEKKGRFWSKRGKTVTRATSTARKPETLTSPYSTVPEPSKTSINNEQQARIQRAAAQLQHKQRQQEMGQNAVQRRGREGADMAKTNSIMSLKPAVISELTPAMKWASRYDKEATRAAYLANNQTGKGAQSSDQANGRSNGHVSPPVERDLPAVPQLSAQSEVDLSKPPPHVRPTVDIPPAPMPPTPTAVPEKCQLQVAAEELPAERERPSTPTNPLRMKGDSESSHLITPPRKTQQQSLAQFLSEIEPAAVPATRPNIGSPDSNRLKKKTTREEKKVKSGMFGGMFGRKKNRNSLQMSPESVAHLKEKENKPNNNLAAPASGLGRFNSFRKKSSPVVTPKPPSSAQQNIAEDTQARNTEPAAQPEQFRRSYDLSVNNESTSRLNTADAHAARNEFSRFDQGPLDDVPAFVSDDNYIDERESRQQTQHVHQSQPRSHSQMSTPTMETGDPIDIKKAPSLLKPVRKELPPPEPVLTPAQDRWAQIRKQAAERAVMRSSEDRREQRNEDGETSGDESKSSVP